MLAYVFWHWPNATLTPSRYEELQRAFHAALTEANPSGFLTSTTYRLEGEAAWLGGSPAYADWYLVDDFPALGPLNTQAVSGVCEAPHTAVAHAMAAGAGSLFTLRTDPSSQRTDPSSHPGAPFSQRSDPSSQRGAHPPDLLAARHATFLTKPRDLPYADFYSALASATTPTTLWRRAMVLGPTPEFALLTATPPPPLEAFHPLALTLTPITNR